MDWQERLERDALRQDGEDYGLLYHVGIRPAVPAEYDLEGLVGLTFRLRPRRQGGHVYVTTIDLPAALRLGLRMGLDEGEALAMVDSHERVHIEMQLAGVPEDVEEEQSHFVDAVYLSLRHPSIAKHVEAGDFGLVARVGHGFWEALLDLDPGA